MAELNFLANTKHIIPCQVSKIEYVVRPQLLNMFEEFTLRAAVEFESQFQITELAYLLGIDLSILQSILHELQYDLNLLQPGSQLRPTEEGKRLYARDRVQTQSHIRKCEIIYTPFLEHTMVILPNWDSSFLLSFDSFIKDTLFSGLPPIDVASDQLTEKFKKEISINLADTKFIDIDIKSIEPYRNASAMLWEVRTFYGKTTGVIHMQAVNLSNPASTNVSLAGHLLSERCATYNLKLSELSGVSEDTLSNYFDSAD